MQSHSTTTSATTPPSPLRDVVAELFEEWTSHRAEHDLRDGACAAAADDDVGDAKPLDTVAEPVSVEHLRSAVAWWVTEPAFDQAWLQRLLDELRYGELLAPLRDETALSCFVRLEERTDFLARLNELGVALPQRQKLANTLTKARRELVAAGTLWKGVAHPTPPLPPPAPPLTAAPTPTQHAPPPSMQPVEVSATAPTAAKSATERVPKDVFGRRGCRIPEVRLASLDAGGLLLTAHGLAFWINGRWPNLSHGHAADGPSVRAVARLAQLARAHVFVPKLAAATSSLAVATDAEALAHALCKLPEAAVAEAAAAAATSGAGTAHSGAAAPTAPLRLVVLLTLRPLLSATVSAPSDPLPLPLPPHCHLLPTIDALAKAVDADDRPTTRFRFEGRRQQAVWRGGRGGEDEASSLRGRLVRHCGANPNPGWVVATGADGVPRLDVGFTDVAPRLSRRQMATCRVLLLVDGQASWDPAWTWALGAGAVLVVVGGRWLPPIAELEAWTHYVPVADLRDFDERVRWALEEPAAAQVARSCLELHDRLCSPQAASRALTRLFAEVAAQPRGQQLPPALPHAPPAPAG